MKTIMPNSISKNSNSETEDDPSILQLNRMSTWDWLKQFFLRRGPSINKTAYSAQGGDNVRPGLWNLRQLRVEDVMIPKADIKSVPATISKEDLVHLKDIALKHGFNGSGGRLALKSMLRPLLFVPPSMPIGVLLSKMQADRIHMALVIDEYGGADGLVTIEDLIEQVIGEIEDEHDPDEGAFWVIEKPGCYLAQAKTPLDEFQQEIGRDLSDVAEVDPEEVDTLGGLGFMLLGRVPARGEVVNHPAGVEFEVVDADPRRIKRLRAHVKNNDAR